MKRKFLLLATIQVVFFVSTQAQNGGNTAYGPGALSNNVSGSYHSAFGDGALMTNTSGEFNTAVGHFAQAYGVTSAGGANGSYNSSNGGLSLYNNFGDDNTANGYRAMYTNSAGYGNSANGVYSLYSNTTGYYNTANGASALYSNTTGRYNDANGIHALYNNKTGRYNSAVGPFALSNNTTGSFNIGYGYHALTNNTTGSYNIAIGQSSGPNSSRLTNTIAIGNNAIVTGSNKVRIGNTDVIAIEGSAEFARVSDGRFKKEIQENITGLAFINQLRPVSYVMDKNLLNTSLGVPDSLRSYDTEARKAPKREIGFVAQEVEAIVKKSGYEFPGVHTPESDKDHYSVAYATFVVPLVKAVQELSAKAEDQQKKIEDQQKKIDVLLSLLSNANDSKNQKVYDGEVQLFQNAPNPFSSDTEISMVLPETTGPVSVIVYALDGKEIKSIPVNTRGKAVVKISANELSAGMYIYTLIIGNRVIDTKRMILTK